MANTDPLLGAVIDGRYRIDARLARGGMASVYRALNVRLQRPVAVKFIHPHLAENHDFTARFIREARAAAALTSPHIVSVYDQGVAHSSSGDQAYLVMELVEGPDLRSELAAHGSFSLRDALDITRQVLEALSQAHSAGIVHRDVKPENILLSSPIDTEHPLGSASFIAKVADFGLARAASDATSSHSGQMLGTVAYVAPEIVTRGKSGPQADIYAVGIMLYELISGVQPFTGESPVAVAYAHVNEPMPRLSMLADWIPAPLDALLSRFTAKDPEQRPADGSAALAELIDVVSVLPEDARIRRLPVFPSRPRLHTTDVNDASTEAQNVTATETVPRAQTERLDPEPAAQVTRPPLSLPIDEPSPAPYSSLQYSRDGDEVVDSSDPDAYASSPQVLVTDDVPQKKRSKKPLLITLLLLLVIGAGTAGGYWWFTQGPGLRVEVPDVTGQSIADAHEALKRAGFSADESHEYSDTIEAGMLIGTDPKAGAQIHPSTIVTMIVSDGVEHLTVPDVSGQTSDEAQAILTQARFKPVLSDDWSDSVPEGSVISQSPAAGESIPHDSEVTIVMSKGREPLSVPEIGENGGDTYQKLLEETGFTVERSDEFSDDVPEGAVISVTPEPGTALYRGDSVTIVISKGPELVSVPNVIGKQESDARAALEAAGFRVTVEKVLGGYFGTVRMQSESGGSRIKKGSTIKLTVV